MGTNTSEDQHHIEEDDAFLIFFKNGVSKDAFLLWEVVSREEMKYFESHKLLVLLPCPSNCLRNFKSL